MRAVAEKYYCNQVCKQVIFKGAIATHIKAKVQENNFITCAEAQASYFQINLHEPV